MAHYYDAELKRPSTFNFATDVVDYWATKAPTDSVAMHWISEDRKTERRLSFNHFSQQSHRLAVMLRERLGMQRGDRLLLIMPRLPEWWAICTATVRCGVVVCPATALLVDKDIEYRCNRSESTVFIGDSVSVAKLLKVKAKCPSLKHILQLGSGDVPEGVRSFEALLRSVSDGVRYTGQRPNVKDISMIYFTSGTTGSPK